MRGFTRVPAPLTWPAMRLLWLVVLAVALLMPTTAAAASFGTWVPGQHIYDRAGVLTAAQVADLEQRAAAVERAGAPVLVHLRIQSSSAAATQQDAANLMQAWDVQSAPNARDGLVIFLNLRPGDPRHGNVAIYAGAHQTNGGNLPQYELQRILNQSILPALRQGRIADGIGAGLDAAAHSLIAGPAAPPAPSAFQRLVARIAAGPISALNVVCVLLALGMLAVGQRAYRVAPRRRTPTVTTTVPPGSRSPAEVGALVSGDVGLAQIEGTILDLARRGALAIEPEGKRKVQIRLQDGSVARTPYEVAVWEVLTSAADANGMLTSGAFGRLSGRWGPAEQVLRTTLEEQGLFDPTAGRRRRPLWLAGTVGLTLGLAAMVVAGAGAQPYGVIGGAILLSAGIVCLVLGAMMRATTEAGESEAAPWRGYVAGIKAARGDQAAVLDLDAVVPYAAALGIVGSLDRRLKAASEAGYAPVWLGQALGGGGWDGGFYPYWVAFHGAAIPAASGGGTAGGAAAGGAGASGSF